MVMVMVVMCACGVRQGEWTVEIGGGEVFSSLLINIVYVYIYIYIYIYIIGVACPSSSLCRGAPATAGTLKTVISLRYSYSFMIELLENRSYPPYQAVLPAGHLPSVVLLYPVFT